MFSAYRSYLCYCPLSPFPKPLLLWSDSVACRFASAFPPSPRDGGPSISSAVREAERPLLEPRVRVCLSIPPSAAAQGLKVYIASTALNLQQFSELRCQPAYLPLSPFRTRSHGTGPTLPSHTRTTCWCFWFVFVDLCSIAWVIHAIVCNRKCGEEARDPNLSSGRARRVCGVTGYVCGRMSES